MSMLGKYSPFLRSLPPKARYEKADLLVPALQIAEEHRLKVFYGPFDSINSDAKLILLGITPGWTQMEIASRTVRNELVAGVSWETACLKVKQTASFAGSMRNNLISMLDALNLPQFFGIQSSAELFGAARSFVHTTSAIRYPVFLATRNYNGTNPHADRSALLMDFARRLLVRELEQIPSAVIVPFGNSVERVLRRLTAERLIDPDRWLSGFPHPSGANGHRVRLFAENFDSLRSQLHTTLGSSA